MIAAPNFKGSQDNIDVAAIRRAIREQFKVTINYRAEDNAETNRTIWPIGISYYDANRIIIGWCELRVGFRSFRTDRIVEMEILKTKYVERRKALLSKWLQMVRQESGQPELDIFS